MFSSASIQILSCWLPISITINFYMWLISPTSENFKFICLYSRSISSIWPVLFIFGKGGLSLQHRADPARSSVFITWVLPLDAHNREFYKKLLAFMKLKTTNVCPSPLPGSRGEGKTIGHLLTLLNES